MKCGCLRLLLPSAGKMATGVRWWGKGEGSLIVKVELNWDACDLSNDKYTTIRIRLLVEIDFILKIIVNHPWIYGKSY